MYIWEESFIIRKTDDNFNIMRKYKIVNYVIDKNNLVQWLLKIFYIID